MKLHTPKRDVNVIEESCIGCSECMNECPLQSIELEMPSPVHIDDNCVYCGKCVETCQFECHILKEEYFDQDGKIFYIRKELRRSKNRRNSIDSECMPIMWCMCK